jgi:vacuolar-type H+-ATPase subunit I/STV1
VEPNAFLDALTTPETPEPAKAEPDAPAKTDDVSMQNTEEPPEELPNATPKAAEHWKIVKNDLKKTREELRQERDRAATEIQRRDEELAKLREQAARVVELEEKAKFVDDAERELAIARVEGTREYKETIIAPLKAIEEQAEIIAKASDVDVDRLIDAMTHPDPVKRRELLKEVTAGVDEMDKLDIKRMSDDAIALLQKRDQIRERASEAQREQETVAKSRTGSRDSESPCRV